MDTEVAALRNRHEHHVLVHFVWTARQRRHLLTEDIEPAVYAKVRDVCVSMGCTVHAIGGTTNHVHLLVGLSRNVSPAQLMSRVKGVTSHFVSHELTAGGYFARQRSCADYSVSPQHRTRVVDYVNNQKAHHSSGTLWPNAEPVPDEGE